MTKENPTPSVSYEACEQFALPCGFFHFHLLRIDFATIEPVDLVGEANFFRYSFPNELFQVL